ncbi:MAG TPA: phage portal protein [Nannocystaceae bacterium]|nr:phage portal protein [Nannocystaceae bacterium]
MENTSKARSAAATRRNPFRRPHGAPAFEVEMGASVNGTRSKSLESLLRQIGVARPSQGGSDEVEDPLIDSPTVYACIEKLASAAKSVPIRVWASDAEDAAEVPEGHPIRQLLDAPIPGMGLSDLIEADIQHHYLSGEDWWFLMDADSKPITGDESPGAPIDLPRWILPVSGEFVTDKRDARTGRIRFVSYTGVGVNPPEFALGSTVHFFRYNRRDPQRGLAPVDVAMRAISVGFQAERYQEGVMRSGGPGAYLQYEDEMDPADERRVQEETNESLRDSDVLGGLKVLTGKVKVVPNPATPKDMLPRETLDWSRDTICSVLGVPPPIIGVFDDATYNNITEAWRQFWSTVKGHLDAMAWKVNTFLIARLRDPRLSKCRISFDYSGVSALQEDNTGKVTLAKDLAVAGVLPFADALANLGVDWDLPETPEAEGDASLAAGPVQDTGLNGAQILSIVDGILLAVSEGRLTVEGAIALLLAAFPEMDQAEASRIANGAIVKEDDPDPEPEPDPTGDPPGDEPMDDPAEEAGKSMPPHAPPRSLPPLTSAEERASYHARLVERVMAKPERSLQAEVLAYLERYSAAQLKRLSDYAESGANVRAMPAEERAYTLSDEIEQFLLLIEDAWKAELAAIVRGPLDSAFVGALEDLAEELGVVQVSAADPRVASSLAVQQIQIAEGVTSRLAGRIKVTILEGLARNGGTANAPLQLRIREHLPELTEDLRRVFGTNEARAATIARTETAKAVSTAREVQMKDAGVIEHQWISNRDDHVRDSHRELDGDVRRIGEEFKPHLRRPHDPEAPASETVNCRCEAKPIVP